MGACSGGRAYHYVSTTAIRTMTGKLSLIPDWNPSGLLPPYLDLPASAEGRSPYHVGLTDMVLRFGATPARRALLAGLLDYRAALHAAGVQDGFQWVNGSFVEDKMRRDHREPADIDVVTFFHLPDGQTQARLAQTFQALFDPEANRNRYGVDAYTQVLDRSNLPSLVRGTAYWNSLWSHSRDDRWKGFLEVSLSNHEDAVARATLNETANWEEVA